MRLACRLTAATAAALMAAADAVTPALAAPAEGATAVRGQAFFVDGGQYRTLTSRDLPSRAPAHSFDVRSTTSRVTNLRSPRLHPGCPNESGRHDWSRHAVLTAAMCARSIRPWMEGPSRSDTAACELPVQASWHESTDCGSIAS